MSVWDRFTKNARLVVFYAQKEAWRCGENIVSTEHLLLGLLRESDWSGSQVLKAIGCEPKVLQRETKMRLGRGRFRLKMDMQLSDSAKRALNFAFDECNQLEVSNIDTEHILLGLIREGDGVAWQVLTQCGADLDRARNEVKRRSGPEVVWPPPPQMPDEDE